MKKIIISLLVIFVIFIAIYINYKTDEPEISSISKLNIEKDFYTAEIDIPEDSDLKFPEIQSFVSKVLTDFDKEYGYLSEDQASMWGFDDGRKYELMVTTTIATTSKTVSYILETYTYTGGAHGGTSMTTFTYDSKNKLVNISDVFKDPNWINVIAEKSRKYFKEKLENEGLFNENMLYPGTEPKSENFSSWYLQDDKIVFVFGQYQIGPYVVGIQEYQIDLADLKDLVNPNFLPKSKKVVSEVKKENFYLVNRVIDGDTIEVMINGVTEKVRLIGVNTPETVDPRVKVECFGKEASQFLTNLLTNQSVLLTSDSTQGDRDKYGRLLRYVHLNDILVNKQIIESGYGYEYTYDIPYKYQVEFKEAQKLAEKNKAGLWGEGVCEN